VSHFDEVRRAMSEIARIRAQIDQEIEAMRQAQAYASVASHDIITHRYEHLTRCFERLAAEVGTTAAIEEIARKIEERL
jgi:hypothetical protein